MDHCETVITATGCRLRENHDIAELQASHGKRAVRHSHIIAGEFPESILNLLVILRAQYF